MNEQLRQRYLKQMGFTPWVLSRALPGVRVLPQEVLPADVASVVAVREAPQVAQPDPAATLAALKQEQATAPVVHSELAAPVETAQASKPPAVAGIHDIALMAFHAGNCWLLVEQEDPQAPELSREGFQLVSGILKVVGGAKSGEPRRWLAGAGLGFELPLNVARRSLELFLQGLNNHQALPVLLMASAETQLLLEPVSRYELVSQGKLSLLALSSVPEMLADADNHKRPSWQAMLKAGVAQGVAQTAQTQTAPKG